MPWQDSRPAVTARARVAVSRSRPPASRPSRPLASASTARQSAEPGGDAPVNIGRADIIFFAVLIPSVILHEISHGWVAFAFGDDTAKREGRLTLNPIAHIDPFGTIILPALLIATSHGAFGYAKPVPVNPRNLRDPRNQSVLVSLAGPAVNIVLAVLAAVVLRVIGLVSTDLFHQIVFTVGWANVILAAFNLIPLPPLDGSAVIE